MKCFYFFLIITHISLISNAALLSKIQSANLLPVSIEFSYNSYESTCEDNKDREIKSNNMLYYNFMSKEYSFTSSLDGNYNLPWNILKANFFKNCYKVLRILNNKGGVIYNSAIISDKPIAFKNPDIIGAWISPINNQSYINILKMSPESEINISNDKKFISIKFDKIYELKFNKANMLLEEMMLYNEGIDGELTLFNKITYSSYKSINGYNIPLNISSVFYDIRGKTLGSSRYYISDSSIKFNRQVTNILDFPTGTKVTDMILNKSYIVEELDNSTSKEEKIQSFLEDYIKNAEKAKNIN